MGECSFEPHLQILLNRYILISIVLIGFSFTLKNKKATWLALITAISFWVGYTLQCDFKVNDPERIWRYAFWVGLDTIYLLILFGLYKFKRIEEWQFGAICCLQVFSFFVQLIRLPDAHKFNYFYTDSFYALALNLYNILIIIVVALPTIMTIIGKIKEYKDGRYVRRNGSDHGMFDARY